MKDEVAETLKRVFGYDTFRPFQREIVESTLSGRDTIAILPTGAGKSLCYQLPAVMRDGLTLVVSPLIALMKDQVDQLTALGVSAGLLNSTLTPAEQRDTTLAIESGMFDLMYVAPERLMNDDCLARLKRWHVSAIVVDEAHCISEWGHDFRPEYRMLGALRETLPQLPVLALTATATPRVRQDIAHQLRLREPALYQSSFNRANLSYRVIPKSDSLRQVCDFVASRPDESGIVYCLSRKNAESMAEELKAQGIAALAYHAGMSHAMRTSNQEAFIRDRARVICATIAFGMGINKPDVRFVIHADLPKNVEGYYQQTGRAGRDGLPAECVLLYSRGDAVMLGKMIAQSPDEQAQSIARAQLDRMLAYAESAECRRADLLRHFGEEWSAGHCGNCDNCLEPRETWDATLEAQKLLSCVYRIVQKSGFSVGWKHVADVLVGARTEKILRWGHDELTTYGIGKDRSRQEWADLGRQLVRQGLARSGEGKFPTVELTPQGLETLIRREPVHFVRTWPGANVTSIRPVRKPKSAAQDCDTGLYDRLRQWRRDLADERDVPAYVICGDVTLQHIARSYPKDMDSLRSVPGIGERKLADFGEAIVRIVAEWLDENPPMQFAQVPVIEPPRKRRPGGTVTTTLDRFRSGIPVEQIAEERGLSPSTVFGHLAQALEAGEELDLGSMFTPEECDRIRAAFRESGTAALGPVFESLGGTIDYGRLKVFRASLNCEETPEL